MIEELYEAKFFDTDANLTTRKRVEINERGEVRELMSFEFHALDTTVQVSIGDYAHEVRFTDHGRPPAALVEFVRRAEEAVANQLPGELAFQRL